MLNYVKSRGWRAFVRLCAKNGVKSRIKAFQINLEEAMWACEAEECSWPIGYEELTFFDRAAASCNWEESSPAKENMPALAELSLYTPPVTPGGELSKELIEIASIEYSSNPPAENKVGASPRCEFVAPNSECAGSNMSSLFEPLGSLGSTNSAEGNRGDTSGQTVGVSISKTLPKIIKVERTNINLTIFSNTGEQHCDNREIQEYVHSLMDPPVMDSFKNLVSNDAEFDLSMHDVRGEQSESGRLQSDATVNGVEINLDAQTLPEAEMKTLVDIDVINSLSATSESVENVSNDNIDTLLEDILNSEGHIPVDINDDWLNLLMS